MRADISVLDTRHSPPASRLIPFNDEEVETWEALLRGEAVPEKPVLHKYSPAIAMLLNPTQPDITGAVLFHNISLWQKNRCSENIFKAGKYAIRTLTQLTIDCPYLSRSTVHKAIIRLKTKLRDSFFVRRDFVKPWYSISADLLSAQQEGELVYFRVEDALLHGSIRTAVILHCMRCAMRAPGKWIRDDQGNTYVQLSPSILSRALGFSEDTITRCLRDLCQKNVLSRHPEHRLWYTFAAPEKDDACRSLFAGFDCGHAQPSANIHIPEAAKIITSATSNQFILIPL